MRALRLILALSLLTGVAACGSKSESIPSASSTTSCATPAPGTLTAKSVVNGCKIAISADGKKASIDLPAVTMGEANLDVSRTQVFTSQAGLVQQIRMRMQDDFDNRGKLYEAATAKMKEDAEMPEMIRKAEGELHEILDRGVRPLGFTGTTVTFAQS